MYAYTILYKCRNTEDISIPISLTGILSILKEKRNSRILLAVP